MVFLATRDLAIRYNTLKMNCYSILTITTLSLCAAQASAQTRELGAGGELLDGVAAVVDDGVVLKSELSMRVSVVQENMELAQAEAPPEQRRPLPPLSILEEQVLEQLATRHAGCDLHDELNQTVGLSLEEFRDESPRSFRMLKRIDKAAAAARPVTSVALFCVGFGPVADAVAPAAMHTALHVASDVAGGTVVATLGESAVSQPIAQGVGRLQVWLHSLQQKFAVRRAGWLASQLEELVLGDLLTDLENAAETPTSDAFLGVESTVTSLAAMLDQLAPPPSHTKTTETP